MDKIENHFLQTSMEEFRKYKALGDKTFGQLSEEEMHWQANEESNSVAVIIRHMHGNMRSRWVDFLTSDGEKPDRHRDNEFIDNRESKEELIAMWNQGWQYVFDAMEPLQDEDAMRTVYIRQEPHTVVKAVIRQLMHYAYHVGQIVYVAKEIKNNDWKSLSIPRGQSELFNQQMMK